jgi:hypothetical protein
MRTRILVVLSALVLLVAGCGGSSDDSGGGGGSGGGGLTLKIVEPTDGTSVTTPFTVKVDSGVPLGTTESGKHHIHVWFDDNANQYQVVEADNVQVDSGKLSSGQHTIHASLRNANHSAAGAEAETTVMVTSGGAPAPASSPSDTGGYGY